MWNPENLNWCWDKQTEWMLSNLYLCISTLKKGDPQQDALLKHPIVLSVDDELNHQLWCANIVQETLDLHQTVAWLVRVQCRRSSCKDLFQQHRLELSFLHTYFSMCLLWFLSLFIMFFVFKYLQMSCFHRRVLTWRDASDFQSIVWAESFSDHFPVEAEIKIFAKPLLHWESEYHEHRSETFEFHAEYTVTSGCTATGHTFRLNWRVYFWDVLCGLKLIGKKYHLGQVLMVDLIFFNNEHILVELAGWCILSFS